MNIVVYGIGGVGGYIGALLSSKYDNVYLLARGENAKVMKEKGLILFNIRIEDSETFPVKVIEDLSEVSSVDLVLICVKNYDLEEVAKDISAKFGDKPIIVGCQNGLANREILPKYFTKVIYTVLAIAVWQEGPGLFGSYSRLGEIFLGILDEKLQPELEKVASILEKAVIVKLPKKFENVAHTKLVYNSGNALFALVNAKEVPADKIPRLREVALNLMFEGQKIVQTAGYKTTKFKGMLTFRLMKMADKAPAKTVNKIYKDTIRKTWRNSMVQDIIINQKAKSELEYLTGEMIKLAESVGLDAPYNKAVYELAKEHFKKTPYKPLDVDIVWEKVQEKL